MRRSLASVLFLSALVFASGGRRDHRDYIPDTKTAGRIAQAVLEAQYGDKLSSAKGTLLVDGSNKDYWIVEVSDAGEKEVPKKGGGPAVWINKHSGCLRVMEYMK